MQYHSSAGGPSVTHASGYWRHAERMKKNCSRFFWRYLSISPRFMYFLAWLSNLFNLSRHRCRRCDDCPTWKRRCSQCIWQLRIGRSIDVIDCSQFALDASLTLYLYQMKMAWRKMTLLILYALWTFWAYAKRRAIFLRSYRLISSVHLHKWRDINFWVSFLCKFRNFQFRNQLFSLMLQPNPSQLCDRNEMKWKRK